MSSRAQLHLSWWTEVRLPACSSNCGFCRTQIAQRDPCGNGDRCEPVGQVCCNFISHQPFRILSNHPSLSRSTTRRNFVFLIGIFRTNLLQVVQDRHKPRAGPICVAANRLDPQKLSQQERSHAAGKHCLNPINYRKFRFCANPVKIVVSLQAQDASAWWSVHAQIQVNLK